MKKKVFFLFPSARSEDYFNYSLFRLHSEHPIFLIPGRAFSHSTFLSHSKIIFGFKKRSPTIHLTYLEQRKMPISVSKLHRINKSIDVFYDFKKFHRASRLRLAKAKITTDLFFIFIFIFLCY